VIVLRVNIIPFIWNIVLFSTDYYTVAKHIINYNLIIILVYPYNTSDYNQYFLRRRFYYGNTVVKKNAPRPILIFKCLKKRTCALQRHTILDSRNEITDSELYCRGTVKQVNSIEYHKWMVSESDLCHLHNVLKCIHGDKIM